MNKRQKAGDIPVSDTKLFLILDSGSLEHYKKYSKDDIWIISSQSSFCPKYKDDIFFLAKRYDELDLAYLIVFSTGQTRVITDSRYKASRMEP